MKRFALVFVFALLIPFVPQKAPVLPTGTIIDLRTLRLNHKVTKTQRNESI